MDDEMSADWKPVLRVAHALDRSRFALVYGELEYDDPFSIMLFHDAAYEQPWRRVDVRREINAIAGFEGLPGSDGEGRYALLSNEGDVYFSDADFSTEKIPGAGVQSSDASGRGAMHALASYGTALFAGGEGGQLYRREPDGRWTDLSAREPGSAATPFAIADLHGFDLETVLAVGSILPDARPFDVTQDPAYADDMDIDELTALFERQANEDVAGLEPQGVVRLREAEGERDFAPPGAPDLRALHVETDNDIWIVGSAGTILHGGRERPFEKVSFRGDTPTHLSVTRFRGETVVASDYALHIFDGHLLKPFRPRLSETVNGGLPTPLKVQAVGDILFYFDYRHGVRTWDGNRWETIAVPPSLLEREASPLP